MNRYPVDEKKIKNDGLSSKLGSIPFVQNISEAITRSFGSAVENFYNPLLSQVTGVSPKETPAGIGVTEYIPINKIVRELTDYNNINDLSKAGEIQLNVTAQEVNEISILKELLIKQIESRVRWRESVNFMLEKKVNQFIEIGPGKILSGLVKRIDKNAVTNSINSEEDIKKININD